MTTIETPICIIGAGPAGSTASMFLSQYGIPHVMADRAAFPRDKVCGELFFGRVSHVLKELGVDYKDLITQGILQETRRIRVVVQPQSTDYIISNNSTSILKGKRTVFDGFLNTKARESSLLTYLDNVHLNKFERLSKSSDTEGGGDFKSKSNGELIVSSDDGQVQVKAQLVLLCTGERVSFLHNIFQDAYSPKGETLLVWRQYFKNISYDIYDYAGEIHVFCQPFGHYIYFNPLPDNLTLVEVVVTKKDFHKHNLSLKPFFDTLIDTLPILKSRFQYAEPLGKGKGTSMLLGKNPRLLSDERVLLVGSAAGSIHPSTGFGVGHAMRMGQLAAFHATESLKANDFSASFLKAYDIDVHKRMRDDHVYGYFSHFIMRHIKFFLPLMRFVISSKQLMAFFSSESIRHHLLNPVFYFKKMVKQAYHLYISKSNKA